MQTGQRKGRTALEEVEKGEFNRVDSGFRNWVKKGSDKFPPAKGRYHIYASYACPWAHRCLIVRKLKGLTAAIGVSIVHPTWLQTRPGEDEHRGWTFKNDIQHKSGQATFHIEDVIPDPVQNFQFIRDIYEQSNDQVGKYTVPILYDKETKQIVNNESSEIILMLNSEFNEYAENPDLDLSHPENMKEELQKLDNEIYENINNGVYRCGFATTQAAYEKAFNSLFESLDKIDKILGDKQFLAGDKLTISDIRLWVTLVRFDEVYVVYFKTNKKSITDYPNLLRFCKQIYQTDGVSETLNMTHIKTHYYTSHPALNTYGIIPIGPGFLEVLKQKL